jgi:hypothetical protein
MDNDGVSATTSISGNGLRATYLATLDRLLLNRRDRYLYTVAGEWRSAKGNLTDGLLEAALRGKRELGIYSVSARGTSKWCAWDADSEEDTRHLMRRIGRLPQEAVLIERSRRGIHLLRFFDPPVPWQEARGYGVAYARLCGLPHIEVFPKGGNLNALRMPQTRHPMSRAIYELIDPTTGEVIADPVAYFLRIEPGPIPARWSMPRRPTVRYRRAPAPAPTDLVDLARRYTKLRHLGGGNFVARCPLHRPDNHPSFGILGGTYWRCWSQCCGEGRSHGGYNALRARLRERGLL